MRSIAQAYLKADADVAGFYTRTPRDLFAGTPVPVQWHTGLFAELRARNAELGVTAEVPESGVAVITGQQPALFLGPLYTVYKAITTVNLAQRLEARTGVRHVPIFWFGSDDHDFEEARSASFLGKDHEPFTLRYEPSVPVTGRPMFGVPLDESLHQLIEQAATGTQGSEFREPVTRVLRESAGASDSLYEWNARLMAWLFRDTPLIVFAPHWTEARRLAASVIAGEIEEPLRSTQLLNDTGQRLQDLGFPQQVTKSADECNFFVLVDGRRRKVVYRGCRFVLPEIRQTYSKSEMLSMLDGEPERFSPNVALRCLVQQRLFGPAAYVAGPGEIAYWAQLKPVFEQFDLDMPVVYPRAQAVLTSTKLNQLRERFGFAIDELEGPRQALVERALRRTAELPALRILEEHRTALLREADAFCEAFAETNGVARDMAQRLRARVADQLGRMERSLLLEDHVQRSAAEAQVARLCNSLAPWRKPQERVYTPFSYLFQQGRGLIQRLIDELDPESFERHEVEL